MLSAVRVGVLDGKQLLLRSGCRVGSSEVLEQETKKKFMNELFRVRMAVLHVVFMLLVKRRSLCVSRPMLCVNVCGACFLKELLHRGLKAGLLVRICWGSAFTTVLPE
jgi:hypothetical protein